MILERDQLIQPQNHRQQPPAQLPEHFQLEGQFPKLLYQKYVMFQAILPSQLYIG